ncbi:putative DNA mismatch repair protein PMS1 [Blattamonas nauphoetae]|uniref:DNA mismatch repair protein PMS1 n=1 Tax=Blattamonas nauphoetae TaxID=2049346 RepID=A0ABQ9WY57_9EUKA|nr:putative DNA mismatch repair protein PMS1 [Blattamonas nauphoetae]
MLTDQSTNPINETSTLYHQGDDLNAFFQHIVSEFHAANERTKENLVLQVRAQIEKDRERMQEVCEIGIRTGFLTELCLTMSSNCSLYLHVLSSSLISCMVTCAGFPHRIRPSDVIPSLLALSANSDQTISVPVTRAIGVLCSRSLSAGEVEGVLSGGVVESVCVRVVSAERREEQVAELGVLDGLCSGLRRFVRERGRESEEGVGRGQKKEEENEFSIVSRCSSALNLIEMTLGQVWGRVSASGEDEEESEREEEGKRKLADAVGGMLLTHFPHTLQQPAKEVGVIGLDLGKERKLMEEREDTRRKEAEAKERKMVEEIERQKKEVEAEFARRMAEVNQHFEDNKKLIERVKGVEREERRKEEENERKRTSKEGAAAIEWPNPSHFSVSGSVFTRKTETANRSILTPEFGKEVVRLTFVIKQVNNCIDAGLISSAQTETVKGGQRYNQLIGGAGWDLPCRLIYQAGSPAQNYTDLPKGASGHRIVVEADGRDGKRTLRLSQNGTMQSSFFSNIPVPFRFAVNVFQQNDAVSIEKLEVLKEPQMNERDQRAALIAFHNRSTLPLEGGYAMSEGTMESFRRDDSPYHETLRRGTMDDAKSSPRFSRSKGAGRPPPDGMNQPAAGWRPPSIRLFVPQERDIDIVTNKTAKTFIHPNGSPPAIRSRTAGEADGNDDCMQSIRVKDNGIGISTEDFSVICQRYTTSKIRTYTDLFTSTTHGFRGEALSSICEIGNVTISSRRATSDDGDPSTSIGYCVHYNHDGSAKERPTPCAISFGTTIEVTDIFADFPVRKKYFSTRAAELASQIQQLFTHYSLVHVGIRFVLSISPSILLQKPSSASLEDAASILFGFPTAQHLHPLAVSIPSCLDSTDTFTVSGLTPLPHDTSPQVFRNTPDMLFLVLNRRRVSWRRFLNGFVNLVRRAFPHVERKYPVAYVHVTLPASLCNLNVSPGKETVIIADEDKVIKTLLSSLSPLFPPSTPHSDTPTPRSTSNENISFDLCLSPSHLHFVTKDDDDEEENGPSPLFSPRSSSSQSFGDTLTSPRRSPPLSSSGNPHSGRSQESSVGGRGSAGLFVSLPKMKQPTLPLARDDSDDEQDDVPVTKTKRELTRDDSESESEDGKTVRRTDAAKEKDEARPRPRMGWLKHAKTVDGSRIGPDSFRAAMKQWLRNARDEKEEAPCSSVPFRIVGMAASSSLRLPILSFATPNTLPASPFDLPPDQPTQPSLAQHATQQQPSQSESLLLFVFNPFRAREFACDEGRMENAQPLDTAPEGERGDTPSERKGNAKVTADEAFVLLQNLIGTGQDVCLSASHPFSALVSPLSPWESSCVSDSPPEAVCILICLLPTVTHTCVMPDRKNTRAWDDRGVPDECGAFCIFDKEVRERRGVCGLTPIRHQPAV